MNIRTCEQILVTTALLAASSFSFAQQSGQSPVRPPTLDQVRAALTPSLPSAMASNPMFQARSDWGCEVLMCMSNPNGSTAVTECRPPMERLWRELSRGRPFPTCTLNNGSNSQTAGAWVQPTSNYYNTCPTGTRPLGSGSYALYTQPATAPAQTQSSGSLSSSFAPGVYGGIGDGAYLYPNYDSRSASYSMPPLVCVGAQMGTTTQWITDRYGDAQQQVQVGTYSTVVLQEAGSNASAFDIYIDSQVFKRARY
jgi:hypothetical protein